MVMEIQAQAHEQNLSVDRRTEQQRAAIDDLPPIRTEQRAAIDCWLTPAAPRIEEWWYAAFHIVTAMVGAGVLALPHAMSELGWGPGVTLLAMSWVVTLYTAWQMTQMHEMVPGRRFGRYRELGQHALGETRGLVLVVPQQLFIAVGQNIIYMVLAGKSLQKFLYLVCKNCSHIRLTFFILIFASVQFVLSHLPNFNSICGVSLAAAIMFFSYSTIAWSTSLNTGVQPNVDYSYEAKTTAGKVFNYFSALGVVNFAYAGHNVVPGIQATIPSTPERPSKRLMWRGIMVAYIFAALCYFPVALIGYWMFGNGVSDNILITLDEPAWPIAMANIFVVVHGIGSSQIYASPVFDMIEIFLETKLQFNHSKRLQFIVRTVYVALIMFVAIAFPFFGGLLGFFGAEFAATSYFLPCLMWLKMTRPTRFSLSWFTNWICIILGVLLRVLPAIGGLRQIVLAVKHHNFFS